MKEENEVAFPPPTIAPRCSAISSPSKTLSLSPDDPPSSPALLVNGQSIIKEECRQSTSPQNGAILPANCENETIAADAGTPPISIEKREDSNPDCFKTPALPSESKKTRISSLKKRQQKMTSTDQSNIKSQNVGNTPNDISADGTSNQPIYSDKELLRKFLRIGKHSFLCPRSQQFLARRYPGLVLRKSVTADSKKEGEEEDIIAEIIIDEFSLLLFHSLDEYNMLKEREDAIKAEEEAQEKQRQYEENLRLGKVKKKGRKSKAEIKREKKEAKKKAKQERKDQRRQEREERRLQRLAMAGGTPQNNGNGGNGSGGQGMEEREEKRRQRKEQRKEAKMERREERKRQKQAKKMDERQRIKRPSQTGAAFSAASSSLLTSSSSPSVTNNNLENAVGGGQQRKITVGGGTLATTAEEGQGSIGSSKPLQQPAAIPSSSSSPLLSITPSPADIAPTTAAGTKRPSSAATIGIAAARRNGLIVRPESVTGAAAAMLPGMGPPANKIPKLEEEFGGTNTNRGLLIGIASCSSTAQTSAQPFSIASDNEQKLDLRQKCQQDLFKAMTERDFLQKVPMADPSSSHGSALHSSLQSQQHQLQQALLKTPELAYNYHQSLAGLYSIDPALAAKAVMQQAGFPLSSNAQFDASGSLLHSSSSQKPIIEPSQRVPQPATLDPACSSSSASISSGLLLNPSSFPLGVSLASQLASLAASSSRVPVSSTSSGTIQQSQTFNNTPAIVPFKNGRWCSMHATIAHEIAKHQEIIKTRQKAGRYGEARTTIGINRQQQQQSTGIGMAGGRGGGTVQQHTERKVSTTSTREQGGGKMQTAHSQKQQQVVNSSSRIQQSGGCGTATVGPTVPCSSTDNLQQNLALLMTASGGGGGVIQQQQKFTEDMIRSALLTRMTPGPSSLPAHQQLSGLLTPTTPTALGALSHLLPPSNPGPQGHGPPPHLFGGFPIQPPGPGAGSLTSGNSDAAAAAQLQQQAQLLNLLQQQYTNTNQPQLVNSGTPQQQQLSSLVAAANLISQFGAANNNINPFGALGPLQPRNINSNHLLSALASSNNNNNLALANILNPTALQQHQQRTLLANNNPISSLGGTLAAQIPNSSSATIPSSSNVNEPPQPDSESILAAFLSGQSLPFEPKIFPPSQLAPPSSSNNPMLLNIPTSSSALSIEQLMRSQFGSGPIPPMTPSAALNPLQLSAIRLASSFPTSSTIPPPPSSLIQHHPHHHNPSAVMNPIEQELLMRQFRFSGQPQLQQQNNQSLSNGFPPVVGMEQQRQQPQHQQQHSLPNGPPKPGEGGGSGGGRATVDTRDTPRT